MSILALSLEQEIEQLREENRLLRLQLSQDVISGLGTRFSFEIAFETLWSVALRENQPLAIAIVDLDYLKQANDTKGHSYGDRVIRLLGESIKLRVRDADVGYRLGGDENAIIFPNTDLVGAMKVCEDIKLIFNQNSQGMHTVSIGISACIPCSSMSRQDLFDAADKALYQSKNNGRNKVTAYGD